MDLTGQRFGKLTVLSVSVPKPYKKKSYNCICDCGNTCVRLEMVLKRSKKAGRVSSCGCFTKKYLQPRDSDGCRKAGLHRKNSFVNGSNVQMTLREGTICTNTSGHQVISWSKTNNKWHCFIGYQNYRANLGYFEDLNDAIALREKAQKEIENGTFEDFYFELKGYRLGERQQKYFKTKH